MYLMKSYVYQSQNRLSTKCNYMIKTETYVSVKTLARAFSILKKSLQFTVSIHSSSIVCQTTPKIVQEIK